MKERKVEPGEAPRVPPGAAFILEDAVRCHSCGAEAAMCTCRQWVPKRPAIGQVCVTPARRKVHGVVVAVKTSGRVELRSAWVGHLRTWSPRETWEQLQLGSLSNPGGHRFVDAESIGRLWGVEGEEQVQQLADAGTR